MKRGLRLTFGFVLGFVESIDIMDIPKEDNNETHLGLGTEVATVGLQIYETKTKFKASHSSGSHRQHLQVGVQHFEDMEDFVYLEASIRVDSKTNAVIKRCIMLA